MVEIESIRVLGIDSDDLTHDLLTVKQGAAFYDYSRVNIHKATQGYLCPSALNLSGSGVGSSF